MILGSGALTPGPNRLIEPDENILKIKDKIEELSFWEKKYGRVLTEIERVEIRENSIALLKILFSEHKKEPRSHG